MPLGRLSIAKRGLKQQVPHRVQATRATFRRQCGVGYRLHSRAERTSKLCRQR